MSDREMSDAAPPAPADDVDDAVDFGSDVEEPAADLGEELFGPDAAVQPEAPVPSEPILPPHLRAPAPSTIPQQYAVRPCLS